jgi:DNA-binding PadR family transcriptional regulator
MSVRFAVLGLLREQPDHGYHLKNRFEQRIGRVWQLNLGQVYQTLRALEGEGLIARLEDDIEPLGDDAAHVCRKFKLTDRGRTKLDVWSKKRRSVPRPVRDELLIQLLILAQGRGEEALAAIDAQERVYRRHLARLLARKRKLLSRHDEDDAATLMASVGLEAALLQTGAYLKWLEYCRAKFVTVGSQPSTID